jgi:hypothetical protein
MLWLRCALVLGLLVTCVLVGGYVAKVTDYTYAEVADNMPNFPLSRPAFDSNGVVRLRSNPARRGAGVRPSKCVPGVGGRGVVRDDFKLCKQRYDNLTPEEYAQWQTWADEDDMDVFQFFMRTCQVYERRGLSWPPAVMAAYKGCVYHIRVASWWTPAIYHARLYADVPVDPALFHFGVYVKTETNQDDPASDVKMVVGGWYNDNGADQWYHSEYSFGPGSHPWSQGLLDIPAHNWLSGYPEIYVEVWYDSGDIWVDEFSVTQGGVELNPNPHFNGGWDADKKHPEDYIFLWGSASGGTRLMYFEDVP